MHTEEERTKGTTGALSSSLPLVGQPEPKQTAAGASICQDHLPHELVVVPTAETRTRPAAVPGAVSLSGTRAIVVPAPKRAPAHADTASNRISAAGIGRYVGTFCSNQAGRRNNQKKLGLITLASPVCSFLFRTRSRKRRLWAFRFSLPPGVARYFCCAFHADHLRAFSRHRALQ
jgi:hypothetical protein